MWNENWVLWSGEDVNKEYSIFYRICSVAHNKNTTKQSATKSCGTLLSCVLFCCVFTHGQFWLSGIVVACVCVCVSICLSVCLSVCQSLACPRDNSGPVQTRITKFGTKMQNTLVKVPIVLWNDRHWPLRSNLTTGEPSVPRLLHRPDCFMVSIHCMDLYT